MSPDDDYLARYRDERCERSFARLVDSSLGLVVSIATRILRNPELARDAAQKVFIRLAVEPEKVPPKLPIEVWLHRTTRSIATDMVRSEEARRRREHTAASLEAMKETDANWSRLASEIDAALDELPTADRIAIVMRFFKNRSHEQVGAALGVGSDASCMRVQRALKKLRGILMRRGLTFSVATLAATLPAHASTPLSAGFQTMVTSQALAAASATSLTTPTLSSLLLMKTKTLAIPATCAALLATALWQRVEISKATELAHAADLATSPRSIAARTVRGSPSDTLNDPESMLGKVRRLCAIEPLASREAALLRWAGQFTDQEAMLEVARVLREADDLSPEIRGRAAKALTEHWAAMDPDGAMEAFATSVLLNETSPFGEVRLNALGHTHGFDLIAQTNPTGFRNWLNDHPELVMDLFRKKAESPQAAALLASAGRGVTSGRFDLNARSGSEALIRQAPLQLLTILEGAALKGEGTFTDLRLDSDLLGKSLVAKVENPQEIWSHLSDKLADALGTAAISSIVREISEADPRPLAEALAEAASLEPDWSTPYRLTSFGTILEDGLTGLADGDTAAEDQWWADLDRYGRLINSSANAKDPTYDATRHKMAALASSVDKPAGIEWAKTITDDDVRVHAARSVAMWAAGPNSFDPKAPFIPSEPGSTKSTGDGFVMGKDGSITRISPIGLPPSGSVEDMVRFTEEIIEKTPPLGDIPDMDTGSIMFGASDVGFRLSETELGDALSDRMKTP